MIEIEGARVHNLKNVDVRIPHNSLTVITGLSGSGKSSLAFETIFAEGQRRYMDTFGAYARNHIGSVERPDVDKITGLSPVISIEQKTTNKNPRSTVGTVTEVYDFLRLLYARAGTAVSHVTGEKMVKHTQEEVLRLMLDRYDGQRIYLLAPVVRGRKGHYAELFESVRRKGFLYVRVDGELVEVEGGMKLDRYKSHDIEVVIDKLQVGAKDEERLRRSLETAMRMGEGNVMVMASSRGEVKYYSTKLVCPTTGIAYRDPEPHLFSFNSPKGACPRCKGMGWVTMRTAESSSTRGGAEVSDLCCDPAEEEDTETPREVCPECGGQRLNKEARHFLIGGKNICEVSDMELSALYEWLGEISPCAGEPTQSPGTHAADELSMRRGEGAETRGQVVTVEIVKEIRTRVKFLLDVGLHYLQLSRPSASLSGGESQRIRLATQIGSKLVNVLYILDEPSIGLHQRDNMRLIRSLRDLRDAGNTVIVVEHDRDMMLAADYIVDMGPKAGRYGGEVVFQGTPAKMLETDTLTSAYLKGTKRLEVPSARRGGNGKRIHIEGARGNNLKNVSVDIPLGKFVCVTGVSGSGKSTLINGTLLPYLRRQLYHSADEPFPVTGIEGAEHIDKLICVDQNPLGRTPRSTPATYIGVFDEIRKLYAGMPEAKMRSYKPGRFSFNVAGGRCEACGGNGYKTIQMNFLPDVLVPCEVCHGQRYNRDTLEVRFKGKNIADALDMTVNQAAEFFANQPKILRPIQMLQDVGLGYLTLGQPSPSLSGGESQRVKLTAELAKPGTGRTLYVLDEPTTGLHFDDIRTLMAVVDRLVDKGNTVIIIEHNMDVIKQADHIIDMGPEGGQEGGQVVAAGTPEEVAKSGKGHTAHFLLEELKYPPQKKRKIVIFRTN